MIAARGALACVGLLAACGRYGFDALEEDVDATVMAVPAELPQWQSGSRLRARFADFGGGARELVGWYDANLGQDCTVGELSADGERYCLPGTTNIVYDDAGCTLPIAIWNGSGTPPTFARTTTSDTCTSVSRYFPMGTELARTEYYTASGTNCFGPYPIGGARAFTVGVEIDPSTQFVRTTTTRVGTGRLQAQGWQGEDGSLNLDRFHDAALGNACNIVATTDGQRCVTPGDPTGYFSDAACTVHLSQRPACTPVADVSVQEPCGLVRKYQRGAAYAGTAYQRVNGMCAMASAPSPLYELGPEIAPTTYVLGIGGTGVRGDRIEEDLWVTSDGSRYRRTWRDTARGSEACGVSGSDANGWRCIPRSAVIANAEYGDAACAVPIATINPGCPPSYIYAADTRGFFLHPVDTAAAAPTQRFTYGFSCNASVFDGSATYSVGGPVIPFSEFAAGTLVVE